MLYIFIEKMSISRKTKNREISLRNGCQNQTIHRKTIHYQHMQKLLNLKTHIRSLCFASLRGALILCLAPEVIKGI